MCFQIKLPFPSSVANIIDFGLRSSKKSYYFIVNKPNWEFVDVEEEVKQPKQSLEEHHGESKNWNWRH